MAVSTHIYRRNPSSLPRQGNYGNKPMLLMLLPSASLKRRYNLEINPPKRVKGKRQMKEGQEG